MKMHNQTRRGLSVVMIVTTIFALSCDSENNVVVRDKPSDYFPLTTGLYQIFDVDQVTYVLGVPTTEQYQLKTVLIDSFDRGDGNIAYVQHRYKRSAGSDAWKYVSTWAVQADDRELTTNENNTIYVKYRFPLADGYAWNGNAYNTQAEDEYVLEGVKVSQTIGDTDYEDCLVVNQSDNQDFIVFLDQRKEVYARNIGLVSRQVIQLYYCTQTEEGCLGQQVVEEGIEYSQTLAAHGRE